MPRLAYLVTRAHHGGAQTHVGELIRHFSTSYEVHLATGEEGYLTEVARQSGAKVRILHDLEPPLSPRYALQDLRALREISGWLTEIKPAVVHAHSSKAGGLGRWAALLLGIPTVFSAHGWGFTEGVPIGQKLVMLPAEWIVARFTDAIITVSEADFDLARRFRITPRQLLVRIHNGLPPGEDVVVWQRPTEPVRIVCVARFSAQKDQASLLRALASVDGEWRLTLVGEGPLEAEIRQLASDLGLIGRCEFLGARDDVEAILSESDIFVLPSNWEGFPLTILEAMRCSLPVIATDVGGVSEAVVDDVTGYVVAQADTAGLASALRRTVLDSELRQKLGKAGRERFLSDFVDTKMLDAIEEVYRMVAAKSNDGAPGRTAGR